MCCIIINQVCACFVLSSWEESRAFVKSHRLFRNNGETKRCKCVKDSEVFLVFGSTPTIRIFFNRVVTNKRKSVCSTSFKTLIFFNMFKTSPKTVIKFLSNKSNYLEDLSIILRMPKWTFIKALFY